VVDRARLEIDSATLLTHTNPTKTVPFNDFRNIRMGVDRSR